MNEGNNEGGEGSWNSLVEENLLKSKLTVDYESFMTMLNFFNPIISQHSFDITAYASQKFNFDAIFKRFSHDKIRNRLTDKILSLKAPMSHWNTKIILNSFRFSFNSWKIFIKFKLNLSCLENPFSEKWNSRDERRLAWSLNVY